MTIGYFVVGLFLVDMIFSYDYIKKFRARHPDKDWSVVERNPIIRGMIKSFGLESGIIVGAIIILVILGVILSVTGIKFQYFLLGIYFMVNVQHVANLNGLKELAKIQSNGGKK